MLLRAKAAYSLLDYIYIQLPRLPFDGRNAMAKMRYSLCLLFIVAAGATAFAQTTNAKQQHHHHHDDDRQSFLKHHDDLPLGPEQIAAVVIDMQPLFRDPASPWGSSDAVKLFKTLVDSQKNMLKGIHAHTKDAKRNFFTRFITPETPKDAVEAVPRTGWVNYYRHNHAITQGELRKNVNASTPGLLMPRTKSTGSKQVLEYLLDTLPELHDYSKPGTDTTKTTAGAFTSGNFTSALSKFANVTTLFFAGVETDYCLAATVMVALDAGYYAVIVTDAVGSSNQESGKATLDFMFRRFPWQLRFATSDEVNQVLGAESNM